MPNPSPIINTIEIQGKYSIYITGNDIVIRELKTDSERTDNPCIYDLLYSLRQAVALMEGANSRKPELSTDKGSAHIRYLNQEIHNFEGGNDHFQVQSGVNNG